jgi:hypothetical protein
MTPYHGWLSSDEDVASVLKFGNDDVGSTFLKETAKLHGAIS